MARPTKIVTVTFESLWSSGCLTITGERKALTFARNLRKNHERFIKQYNWNGMWCGQAVRDDQKKLKVSFEVTLKSNGRKRMARPAEAKVIV